MNEFEQESHERASQNRARRAFELIKLKLCTDTQHHLIRDVQYKHLGMLVYRDDVIPDVQ